MKSIKKNKKKQTVTWSFWIKIYNPVKKNKWVTILDPLKKKKSQLCVYRTANISCRLDHKIDCVCPMRCEWLAFIIVVNHYTSSLLSKCLLHVQCRFAGGSKGETLCPCNNPLSVFNIWVVPVNRTILPKVITVHILWMFTWNCLECYDNQIILLAVVFMSL